MIENDDLQDILETATDLSVVCEIYAHDATPGTDGFDPSNAIGCFAAVNDVSFKGVDYERLVQRFSNIGRKITAESNTATVEFSNLDGQMAAFEFANGFEGLIMVIRLLSRSLSDDLTKTAILFTGRCEKPKSGNKESLSVTANWILGGLEVTVPRRKYAREDQEGRVPTDPEFEGFLFIPQTGTTNYSIRLPKTGFWNLWGLLGGKKYLQRTLHYSSYSDLDSTKPVPEVFGRAQLVLTHIAYADVGSNIQIRSAACEGPIYDIQNARSLDARMPLSGTDYAETMGLIGAANNIGPSWVGPGNYSKTALIIGKCTNSAVETVEPAPEIVAVILGRLMTIPDSSGDWVLDDEWSDNGAAHTRFIITSDDYYKLHENWVNDESFAEVYEFNNQYIIDRSLTDFMFATPA